MWRLVSVAGQQDPVMRILPSPMPVSIGSSHFFTCVVENAARDFNPRLKWFVRTRNTEEEILATTGSRYCHSHA